MAMAIRESGSSRENKYGIERFPLGDYPKPGQIPSTDLMEICVGAPDDVVILGLLPAEQSRLLANRLAEGLSWGATLLPVVDTASTFPLLVSVGEVPQSSLDKQFEDAYENFGIWKGPYASRTGNKSQIEFWKRAGYEGIYWLIRRIRGEGGNETLNAVASVLAKLGPSALSAILGTLETRPTTDQAYCLLRSIGRMGPQANIFSHRLASTIEKYIDHPDADVREAAVSATSALPAAKAIQVLRTALAQETDAGIAEFIEEEIEERKTD